MTKLVGSIVLIGSTILIFYHPVFILQSRITLLKNLIFMLNQIKRELQTYLWSISDMMNHLLALKNIYFEQFIGSVNKEIIEKGAAEFPKKWKENVLQFFPILSKEEQVAIAQLGDVLGRYTLNEQITVLEKTICILEESLCSACDYYHSKSHYSLGIGTSVGLIVAILLL